jgi:hypothetical protein
MPILINNKGIAISWDLVFKYIARISIPTGKNVKA